MPAFIVTKQQLIYIDNTDGRADNARAAFEFLWRHKDKHFNSSWYKLWNMRGWIAIENAIEHIHSNP